MAAAFSVSTALAVAISSAVRQWPFARRTISPGCLLVFDGRVRHGAADSADMADREEGWAGLVVVGNEQGLVLLCQIFLKYLTVLTLTPNTTNVFSGQQHRAHFIL